MPRLVNRPPAYRRHPNGQAAVSLSGKTTYLGKYGSKSSRDEYRRLLNQWEANRQRRISSSDDDLSINELILSYWQHVQSYYRRPDGTPTSEVENIRQALRAPRRLYGHTLAVEFGPLALQAVRNEMIGVGWSRSHINKSVDRIKRMFKWAAAHELVPSGVYHGLQTVAGLRKGRSEARETEPVRPVPQGLVQPVVDHVNCQIATMIQLQLLTGMRPGEVVTMRGCDLETSGKTWFYRPRSHKTAHHGHEKVVAIGPRAQAILKPFLKTDLTAYLFDPREAEQQRNAERRRQRQTPLWPSHVQHQAKKRKTRRKREAQDHYTVASYRRAIGRGCDKAFPPPGPLAQREDETKKEWMGRLTSGQKEKLKEWQKAHRWHPHQLRHSAATQIRKEFGLEVARAVLGHRTPVVTEIYAELDSSVAASVMEQIG